MKVAFNDFIFILKNSLCQLLKKNDTWKLPKILISVKKIFYLSKNFGNSLNVQLRCAKLGDSFIS